MKTRNRTFLTPLFAMLIVLMAACSQEQETVVVDPAIGEHISAYTTGVIPRGSQIRIRLAQAYPGAPEAGTELEAGLLDFNPALKGKAFWVDNRTIEFVPDAPLPSGTLFTATFDLGKVKEVSEQFEEFKFQFSTITQSMELLVDGVESYDSQKLEWQQIKGHVVAADLIDTAGIYEVLTAHQGLKKKALNISWAREEDNIWAFTVDSVSRSSKSGFVMLTWFGSPIGVDCTGEERVEIPALGDFHITDVDVTMEPEQFLEVYFSDPLKAKQYLSGIITLSGIENLTYTIEGNKVIVHPPYPLTGSYTLNVSRGLKNSLGYRMSVEDTREVTFEELKPAVKLTSGNGTILPNSEGLLFPFEAVSLKAVDVQVTQIYEDNMLQFLQVNHYNGKYQMKRVGKKIFNKTIRLDDDPKTNLNKWNTFAIDLKDIVKQEPGAIYNVQLKFRKEHAICDCEEEEGEEGDARAEPMPVAQLPELEEWTEKEWTDRYDYDRSYWYDYDYDYSQRHNPCNSAYYRRVKVAKNILTSDLGIMAKAGADKKMHVFVNNIIDTRPVPGAKVEFYGFQQQLLATARTNEQGMLEMYLPEKPFAIVTHFGAQRGYLKLRDGEALSMSKFDVEGDAVNKGIKGLLYGERGVWRPGDSLYLSFIMEDKEHLIPDDHPINFTMIDPRGQIVENIVTSRNLNGFYDFRTATHAEAPTGNYVAKVAVGNRTFTKRLKVETVKPNRLKIYMDFGKDVISATDAHKGKINVKWLHGATARNLKTKIELALEKAKTTFKRFKGYSFDDPVKEFSTSNRTIFNANLDEEGNAEFDSKLSVGQEAPGMLRASYTTKVFEEGGGFSIDRYSVAYSPFTSYVGVSVPEGNLYRGTLQTDQDHTIMVASVTEDGKGTSRSDLEVEVYHLRWRWWWDRYDNDLASYLARESTVPLMTKTVRTSKGRGHFRFRVDRPNWGRYLVLVKDPVSGHTAGQIFFVDWPYWARSNRTNNEFATMLSFSSDKENYNVGEMVKVSFPSASEGRALISVENGTKILHKEWIETKKGETKFEFPVTADMAPNVFVHVALLQPHAATANDLPVRLYGVIPVMVEDPKTHLEPVVTLPGVLRPESTVTVKVKENKGRRMTYTLAMVDEGLLDLTRFKTPDPWNHFYAREALGVKTWDMYDDVIGVNNGKFERILSIGGDAAAPTNKAAKANRFKPVVKFLGPFELKPGEEASHKIRMPNYVGSVRVMVVAGQDGTYGSTDKTVPVRSPLMVLGTLPRVLGPGENVSLPVNVFAMEKHVKNVDVEIIPGDMFVSRTPLKQRITFDKPGDEVLNFKLDVLNKIGVGKVKIIARSGREKAVHEIELDVRTPNPRVKDIVHKVLKPGESWNPRFNFDGVEGTNNATVEVTSMPPINMGDRLNYLIRYPHGCIEQTTSSVFPQLFVSDVMPLKSSKRKEVSTNIQAGLQRLTLFQTNAGGFGYWPGAAEDSEWGTNYGGHFMLEAEKQGYRIPTGMKKRWKAYQKKKARDYVYQRGTNNFHGLDHNKDLTQAYRLYTLALAGSPEMSAMNRLRENPDLSHTSRWRLAAAYVLAGQPEVAKQLVYGVKFFIEDYKELSYTYGSAERDEAMILETMILLKKDADAMAIAKKLAERMSDSGRWLSTQSTAYCLLGLSRYYGKYVKAEQMQFSYALGEKAPVDKKTNAAMFQLHIDEGDFPSGGKMSFTNNSDGALYVSLATEGIPVTGDQSADAKNLRLDISYKTMSGKTLDPAKIEQGTDFIAEVTVTNPGTRGNLKEMALTQIFPSGWEIHNTRMDVGNSGVESSQATYQDIRDDRVYTYYNLRRNKTKTFRIKLNATYMGRFYLPTVSSDAMYDNAIYAHQPGKWVEVVAPGDETASNGK